jgi:hypothetical protein
MLLAKETKNRSAIASKSSRMPINPVKTKIKKGLAFFQSKALINLCGGGHSDG